MPSYDPRAPGASFQTVLDAFAQAPDLPFRDVLTADYIEQVAAEEGATFGAAPGRVYTVAVTLWAFLAQVLSKEKSCLAAVARVMAWLIALGRQPCQHRPAGSPKHRPGTGQADRSRSRPNCRPAVLRSSLLTAWVSSRPRPISPRLAILHSRPAFVP